MTDSLIVAGDSQSAARAAVALSQTWGAIVARNAGVGYVNCAVAGDTSSDLLARFPAVLANAGSKLGIMIGANDAYVPSGYTPNPPYAAAQPSAVSVALYEANLEAMADAALAAGKSPFLVTPWAFWSTTCLGQFPFYVAAMKTVASAAGIPCFDAYQVQLDMAAAIGQSDMWSDVEADYQHPNSGGHYLISLRIGSIR